VGTDGCAAERDLDWAWSEALVFGLAWSVAGTVLLQARQA
jgi:predicted Kef-type K+ transport protein